MRARMESKPRPGRVPRAGTGRHGTRPRRRIGKGEAGVILGKRVAVVLPAYNASRTLRRTVAEIPADIVDDIILTDDASTDDTVAQARALGIATLLHDRNRGYGGNQKTCYAAALARGADIVVMLHPDYQYSPRLVTAMASMIASELYDVVLGSRIIGGGALKGGMPRYKYAANRALTFVQNLLVGQKLSEYHTGYRAWSRAVLQRLPLQSCSEDFVFDNQMLVQAVHFGFRVGEISCPTRYFAEASSINLRRSIVYGLGVLATALQFRLQRLGLVRAAIFEDAARHRLHGPPHLESGVVMAE
jgi:glycosyltransferase involved in cell wall biosynthesis